METPSRYYDLCLDRTNRTLTIILDQQTLPEHELESEHSTVGFLVANDGLPYVCDVTITDPNKISILEDWIEEGIEAALNELNARKNDDFANNYWKGERGGTEDGRLSSV